MARPNFLSSLWRRLTGSGNAPCLASADNEIGAPTATLAAELIFQEIHDYGEYCGFLRTRSMALAQHRVHERALMETARSKQFGVPGFCHVCNGPTELLVDFKYSYAVDGVLTPNWRERLVCPVCGYNNRMRATIHILESKLELDASSRVYLTEQLTPLFAWMSDRYPGATGSEYLGLDVPLGEHDPQGTRNEDLTALSFPSHNFDLVISLDVLEHIPDYPAALAEIHRVLDSPGQLLLSVPFRLQEEKTLVRARLQEDGEVEHLLPPEIHGDPVRSEGCLAFYHFGWDLFATMRDVGFANPRALVYWSQHYGYLGAEQVLFIAEK